MKVTFTKLYFCCILLLLVSCSSAKKSADNGFDQICQIYTQVLTDPSNKSRTQDEKMVLIYKNIQKAVTSKVAREQYEKFLSDIPSLRYKRFKEVAEFKLKRSWDCPIIKTIHFK